MDNETLILKQMYELGAMEERARQVADVRGIPFLQALKIIVKVGKRGKEWDTTVVFAAKKKQLSFSEN